MPNSPGAVFDRDLECTICLSLCDTNMFSCQRHHLVCEDCLRPGIQKCPVCRQDFVISRNFLAERLIEALLNAPQDHGGTVSCPNQAQGKSELLYKEDTSCNSAVRLSTRLMIKRSWMLILLCAHSTNFLSNMSLKQVPFGGATSLIFLVLKRMPSW